MFVFFPGTHDTPPTAPAQLQFASKHTDSKRDPAALKGGVRAGPLPTLKPASGLSDGLRRPVRVQLQVRFVRGAGPRSRKVPGSGMRSSGRCHSVAKPIDDPRSYGTHL